MTSPAEEDPYVLVDELNDGGHSEDADDEGFVLTGETELEERLSTFVDDEEEKEDQDEHFVLVAETLDRIMEDQNNENEQTRRSAFIVVTVIASYLYSLMSLTTIVSLLHPSSSWWRKKYRSHHHASHPHLHPHPSRNLHDILQTEDLHETTVEFPSPSIYIPTIAHSFKSDYHPFVGYPVVPPKAAYDSYYHDRLQVPRRADYTTMLHVEDDTNSIQEDDTTHYMPSPSPPRRKNGKAIVDQVRFSAAAYASPPKVEPIMETTITTSAPFPSIAAPWTTKPVKMTTTSESTALMMIPTRRYPTTNHTVFVGSVPSIAAPKSKPILLPRHHPGALGIPTVMRIPFAPTLHIPHATTTSSSVMLWQWHNATAPPKDPSITSYDHVLVAFFPSYIGTELDMWWKKLQESVDSVPSVRIDCATVQDDDDDDELAHLCDTTRSATTTTSTTQDRPSLYLLRHGQIVQQLPFRHHIDNILVHLERAVAQASSTTTTMTNHAPVTLRSTPLTDDSFPAFIDTHRFSIVVFYHPTQQTATPSTATNVWRTFHQHHGPGRATVNCQAYPTTCQTTIGDTFPRLQRYRYGRTVIVPDEEEQETQGSVGVHYSERTTNIPSRPSQPISVM